MKCFVTLRSDRQACWYRWWKGSVFYDRYFISFLNFALLKRKRQILPVHHPLQTLNNLKSLIRAKILSDEARDFDIKKTSEHLASSKDQTNSASIPQLLYNDGDWLANKGNLQLAVNAVLICTLPLYHFTIQSTISLDWQIRGPGRVVFLRKGLSDYAKVRLCKEHLVESEMLWTALRVKYTFAFLNQQNNNIKESSPAVSINLGLVVGTSGACSDHEVLTLELPRFLPSHQSTSIRYRG